MAEKRYRAALSFEANEQDAEEGTEPMVKADIVWNRNTYEGLVMLEESVIGSLLKTVEYAKSTEKYSG